MLFQIVSDQNLRFLFWWPYIALVRSTLEYDATAWDPYLEKDIYQLARIQRKAADFIKKDYKPSGGPRILEPPPQKFFGAPVLAEISKIVTRSTPENIAFFWEKLIKSNDFTISQFSSFSSSEGAPSSALWAPHCGLRPPATAGSAGMLGGPPLHKPTTPGNMVLNITIACKASSEIAIPGE